MSYPVQDWNRKCTPATNEQAGALIMVKPCLEDALQLARKAGCGSLIRKIKSALKSHEGAGRHMQRRLNAGGNAQ